MLNISTVITPKEAPNRQEFTFDDIKKRPGFYIAGMKDDSTKPSLVSIAGTVFYITGKGELEKVDKSWEASRLYEFQHPITLTITNEEK